MIDAAYPSIPPELINVTRYIVEAFVAACFLTFLHFISPYIRGAK